jgi:carbon storage regulator
VLVLRRKRGQSIVIGKHAEIIIKVLHDIDGVISIGIKAPKFILVDRLEVYEKRLSDPHEPYENFYNEDFYI